MITLHDQINEHLEKYRAEADEHYRRHSLLRDENPNLTEVRQCAVDYLRAITALRALFKVAGFEGGVVRIYETSHESSDGSPLSILASEPRP